MTDNMKLRKRFESAKPTYKTSKLIKDHNYSNYLKGNISSKYKNPNLKFATFDIFKKKLKNKIEDDKCNSISVRNDVSSFWKENQSGYTNGVGSTRYQTTSPIKILNANDDEDIRKEVDEFYEVDKNYKKQKLFSLRYNRPATTKGRRPKNIDIDREYKEDSNPNRNYAGTGKYGTYSNISRK